MSNQNLTTVNILDKDYQVACPQNERDTLQNAAHELDQRMRTIRNSGSIIGLERIAVMAALNLCYELQQAKNEKNNPSALNTNIEKSLTKMSEKIAAALEN